jgi:hypothetical protein
MLRSKYLVLDASNRHNSHKMASPTIVYLTGQDTDSYKEEHASCIRLKPQGMYRTGEECVELARNVVAYIYGNLYIDLIYIKRGAKSERITNQSLSQSVLPQLLCLLTFLRS